MQAVATLHWIELAEAEIARREFWRLMEGIPPHLVEQTLASIRADFARGLAALTQAAVT